MKNPAQNLTQKQWIILVVALQLLALGFIAAKREWILNNGALVYLRTAPVDPRDLFRGDYVQLEYEISQPHTALLQQEWLQPEALRKQPVQQVYLQLRPDPHGIATLTGISREKPAGLFIRGSIEPRWNPWNSNSFIKLGIEKYFVEQGAGLALEQERGRGQGWQTPLEMQVAIGSDGTAVIRSHRWSGMGIRLEVLEPGITANPNRANATTGTPAGQAVRQSARLRISVRNQSQKPVAFIDSANHCAFSLAENGFQPAGAGQVLAIMATPNRNCNEPVEWQEQLLQPGETHAIEIDLADPLWHVMVGGKAQELGALQDHWQGFRWIYELPESARQARAGRPEVWFSSLRTARFMASGRVD